MKVSELEGAELDILVAKAENIRGYIYCGNFYSDQRDYRTRGGGRYSPSTDWEHGGPIIEREKMKIQFNDFADRWTAISDEKYWGETLLIAAMRAFVASRYGETVGDTLPDSQVG